MSKRGGSNVVFVGNIPYDISEENRMLEKKCAFYEKEVAEARKHLQDLVKSMEKASVA